MRASHRFCLRPLGLALCLALAYPVAHALPQGAQVVQGQAKVSTPEAGQGLIQQGSDKAVINWQSFSIGAGEHLRIEQPGVNSVLLNRVVGGDPSLILGHMQSNGQVFLINPRGIVFGRGSQVDAGSFVASTLDLSDSAFLAGSYRFTAGAGAGGLQADGSISAPGGTVALVAPQLGVDGSVQARRVGLAAASGVTVDVEGDGLVLFNLRNDDRDVALKFGGHIQADGGSAELRAQARGGAAGQVLNMDGLVQARGLRQQGGRIVIDGGTAGDTTVNGSLDATGETGGGITVLGQRVALLDAARLDASGRLGGGNLQVGGGFHGESTDHNAERTWVAGGAQLRADATGQGDGGRVAIWADLRTDMMGQVSARGGALGGNGGSVETSGKQQLNMPSGGVDLGAPRGRAGSWLLDPNDLTIAGSGSDSNVAPSAPFVTTGNNAVLTVATLNPALTGGATVIVRTASASGGGPPGTGSIDVQGTILPAGAATLNLIAQGNITFSTGKIAAGPGALNVNLLAGSDASGGNPGGQASTITATGAGTIIDTNGGALAATAKDGIAFSGVKSAALTITSTNTVTGGAVVLPTGTVSGNLQVSTSGVINQASGGLVVTGTSSLSAGSAAITLTDAANNLQGAVRLTGGTTQVTNTKTVSNALTLGTLNTGALTVTAGGGTLTLGTGTVTGALSATSGGGAITQASGGLVVTGMSSLNAGSAAITLTDSANNLQGAVSLTGGTTQVSNGTGNALTLGALNTADLTATAGGGTLTLGTGTVTGALRATSGGGAIAQAAGGLVVTGTSTLNATSAAITLTDAANDLQGTVNLTGGVTQIKNTKNASNALTLGTLSTADLTATAGGGTLTLGTGTVTGALSAASGGGAITQAAGGLVVTGASTLNATSAAITLTDTANNLQGAVSLTGGTTQVSNGTGNALTLGTLSTGALTVTAGGGTLTLGTGTVTGALSATSGGGAITQAAGGLVVTGASTLNAASAAITLTDSANDLQGPVNLTGGVTQIKNTKNASNALTLGTLSTGALTVTAGGGPLTLGTGTVTGALNATSGGGAIAQAAGGLVVTGVSTLNATSAAITLTDAANNLQGAVSLTGGATQIKNTKNASNALTLGTLSTADLTATAGGGPLTLGTGTVTGALSATSGGGAISQAAGGLVVTGAATLNAASAAITLTDSANDLQGTVNLTSGVTQIKNTKNASNALTLGTLSTADLTATAGGGTLTLGTGTVSGALSATSGGGAITQAAGGLVVTGASTLNAASAAITLTDSANDLQGTVNLTGGATQIKNTKNASNALTLGTLSTADLTATAGGGTLTLGTGTIGGILTANSGGGAVAQAAGGLVVTGNAGVNAGSAAITLSDSHNDWRGRVALTGGATAIVSTGSAASVLTLGALNTGNLSASTAGGNLTLGTGTVAGTLNASSGGGTLTQAAGGITVSGIATLNATLGGDVTLTDAHNHWNGGVQLTGNSLDLRSAGDLSILALSQPANRALTLESDGNLSLGAVDLDTGMADLSLTSLGGSFTAGGKLAGHNIALVAQTGLNLGHDITAGGTLSLGTASGGINQTAGSILVTGTTTAAAGSSAIGLGQAGNHFGGAVQLTGGSSQIVDSGALTLGTLNTGNLVATSNGTLNLGQGSVAGTLTASSNGGNIVQSGALTLTGATSLNAGSAAITLAQVANDLQGAIAATGGAISLRTAHNLVMSALSQAPNQALDLEAAGTLTLPAGTIIINTGTAALTLVAQGGAVNAPGTLSGSDITLRGQSVVLAHDVTAAGNLVVQGTAGTVNQTAGRLAVAGSSQFDAGAQALTLGSALNDFQGTVSLTGGATQIAATSLHALDLASLATGNLTASSGNALRLGTGTVSGTLSATSTGAMTQAAGGIAVTGNASLNAGSAAITLLDAANSWGGTVALAGAASQLRGSGAVTLAAGHVDSLALTAGGAVGQSAALTVAGALNVNAGSAAIGLGNLGNSLGGAVALTGGASQVSSAGALTLGSLSIGDLTAHSSGALNLGQGTIGGNLVANSGGGAVTQGGALNVGGSTDVQAGSAAVTLTQAGNHWGGAVGLAGGTTQVTSAAALSLGTLAVGALTADASGALGLGQGTVGANLVATSHGGAISQAGALDVTGTANVQAGSGTITLAQSANRWRSAVQLGGAATQIAGSGALTLGLLSTGSLGATSTGALNLGQGSIVGTLTAASGGNAITQAGALQLSGGATLNAGSADITLTAAGNQLQGPLRFTGGAVTVVGQTDLDIAGIGFNSLDATSVGGGITLGSGSIAGALTARAQGGGITQTAGGLSVAGTTTLQAVNGITLNDAANHLQGGVNLGGGSAVALTNAADLHLGTLATAGLSLNVGGALDLGGGSVAGNLAATSSGSITQSGMLSVSGGTTLNTGSASISLGQSGNAFTGTVNLSGGDTLIANNAALKLGTLAVGSLTVSAVGPLQLGTGSVSGMLAASSSGAMTQAAGGLGVSGSASLNAGGGAIQLTDGGNAFNGAVSLLAGDASLSNGTALLLGASTLGGNLTATTRGASIGQSGALVVAGSSSFVADGSAASLVLGQAGNQLHGTVSTAGLNGGSFSSASIVNALDLSFSGDARTLALNTAGLLTLGGGRSATLTATAVTGIAQTGALDVSGLTTLIANGAALPVDLSGAGNELARVQLTAAGGSFARVQLRDGDASRHDGLQVGGDAATLEITSAGALDLAGGSYTRLLADTSASGAAITQSGRLAVAGGATLKAGGGAVTLMRADNSLPSLGVASAGSASIASAGDMVVNDSQVSTRLALASPGAVSLGGTVSGSGELVVSGSGSLTISAAQAYGGGTRIQSGSLVLQGAAAVPGSGAVQLGAGGQLDLRDGATLANALVGQGGSVLNSSGSATLAGAVTLQATTLFLPAASAGGLTISGAIGDAGGGFGLRLGSTGMLTLAGSNHYGGITDIAAGTLRAASAGALPSGSALQLGAGALLALGADQQSGSLSGAGRIDLGGNTLGVGADGGDGVFSGNIGGSGGLTKLGAGSLTLSGNNGHSGATHLAAGQLILASATALNDSTAVTVDAGATLAVQQSLGLGSLAGSGQVAVQAPLLSVGANGGSTVFDGVLSGSGGLAKLGSGRLTLAGHNRLGGDVQLGAGSLQLAAPGALSGGTAVAVAGGATLELLADESLGALTGAGQVQLNANTLTLGATGRDGRFDGVVGGSGNLAKAGSGTLTLGGANLYTGTTHVGAGTLNLAAAQVLAGASSLVIDAGGSVQVNAGQAVAALAGSGGLALNGATLAVGAGGADSRFDGVVSGTGGLTKQGAGTLTLTATAINSGVSVIEAGTVKLTGAGSLGSGDIQNQGRLALGRSDAFTLGQAVNGSGSLVVQQGQVTLANGGNSYSGATQVLGGTLVTTAAERLPDASAVQVAAGAQLQLGGNETIASLQAAGSVHLAGDLTTKGDQIYTGSLTLANPSGITLGGATIDASKSTNQFNGTPLGLNGAQALVTVKEALQLGNVTLSGGGRIEAARLDLNGKLQLAGGSLSLVANAAPDDAKATPQGVAQVPLAGVSLALAEATVQQGSSGAITVADGARLAVQAAGGGSVVLGQDANSFKGQLSVLSGARYDTAWVPNVKGSIGVQSLVRVAGQQLLVGGTGIEADVVSIRADQLATADGAKLVARLPFDETLLGKSLSLPSMTLELTPAAYGLGGSFGTIGGVPIQVEVGSTKTGARTSGPNAGYLTVLPKGGAKGATVIVLAGPEVGSGTVAPYRFFHDGARQATEIPVVYNGVLPLTPSASGALSSINGDAEDARRARFQETVRTENVTVRLRSGVIAEVGPGRASTQGSEGATPPVQCDPAAQPALSCK